MPAISSCGKKIVFSSTRDGKTYHLRLLELDPVGKTVEKIKTLTFGYADLHPCFTPDGQKVIFSSNRGGYKHEKPLSFFFNPQSYGDIFCLDLNSLNVIQLTSTPYEDSTATSI